MASIREIRHQSTLKISESGAAHLNFSGGTLTSVWPFSPQCRRAARRAEALHPTISGTLRTMRLNFIVRRARQGAQPLWVLPRALRGRLALASKMTRGGHPDDGASHYIDDGEHNAQSAGVAAGSGRRRSAYDLRRHAAESDSRRSRIKDRAGSSPALRRIPLY